MSWYLFFKAILWFELIVRQEYYSVSRLLEDTLWITIVSHVAYGAVTMWEHFQSNNERVESFNRTLNEMLRRKIQKDLTDLHLQLPACSMACWGVVHEPAGVSPNLLILSRKLEVPLDVVTERSPDTLPLKAEYALAVQKRMASAYDLARRHLNKVSVRQKRNNDKQLTGRPSLLVILFGYITFRGRRGETPNLTVFGKDPMLSDVVGAPYAEEPKDQAQGCFSNRVKP